MPAPRFSLLLEFARKTHAQRSQMKIVVVAAAAAAVLLWSTAPANASAASWITGTFKRARLDDDSRRNSHSNIINARLENNGLQTQPQTLASNDGSVDLNNVHDLLYLANLTVGGTQYVVQVCFVSVRFNIGGIFITTISSSSSQVG